MSVVPVPPTITDGVPTTSQLQALSDAAKYALNPPRAEVRQGTTATTLTTGVWAALGFDTHDVDTDYLNQAGHSDVTNNSRYTANFAGWYDLGGGVSFSSNATGIRGCRWAVNGSAVNASAVVVQAVTVAATTTEIAARSMMVYLNVGDYVELQAVQGSGGNLATIIGGAAASRMSVRWRSN